MRTQEALRSIRAAIRSAQEASASLKRLSDSCRASKAWSQAMRVELKRAPGEGRFTGYASVFGNVDGYGDVILRGAFANTLASRTFRPLLWQHDPESPIGYVRLKEDGYGLFAECHLTMEVSRAREAEALLRDGAIGGLSIGYRTQKEEQRGGVRYLKEIDLLEVSVVTFPANQAAVVTAGSLKRVDPVGELYQALHNLRSAVAR